jgi:amidohydrolase
MTASTLHHEAEELFLYTQAVRRDLHIHPELGYHEQRTSGLVAYTLNDLGMEVMTGVGKTGVVGLLEGDQPGKTLLVRFDMDALPIQEETGAEYASQTQGVMHACGHDGHVAIGLTVAKILSAHQKELHGRVKFVFQPAEEAMGGAHGMIEDGVLENPKVDATLALHLWNGLPLGCVALVPGPLMSAAETLNIKITGKGGHGALPNATIDPVVAAAQVIIGLQTIVSRNISPLDTAVISVTKVQAGETHNVIPPYAILQGTIRTFLPETRTYLLERFDQVVNGICQAMGCTCEIEVNSVTPAVINDPALAKRISQVTAAELPELTIDHTFRTMVSEDMGEMMKLVPGCYMMVGSANDEKGLNYGHHHPKFDFDEQALINGAALMSTVILDYLKDDTCSDL